MLTIKEITLKNFLFHLKYIDTLAKFLITEESFWITGQIIAVGGGRSKLS